MRGLEAAALGIPASAVTLVGHGGIVVGAIKRGRVYELELVGSEPVLSTADQNTSLESAHIEISSGAAAPAPSASAPPSVLPGFPLAAQATGLTALGTNNVIASQRLRMRCDDLLDALGLDGSLTAQVATTWYNSSAAAATLTTYGTVWRVRQFDYDITPGPRE
jgi:hypothetical protein